MGLAQELMSGVTCNEGGERFVSEMLSIAQKMEREQNEWIARLRAVGVKAAHPDDGWIDRQKNIVFFCYPQFNDGAKAGDLVALGWPEWGGKARHRLVRLVKPVAKSFCGIQGEWYFVPAENHP